MKNPLLQSIKETRSPGSTVAFTRQYGQKRFGKADEDLLARRDVSASAKVLLTTMRMESKGSGGIMLSYSWLGQKAGMTKGHVCECTRELETKGFIEKNGAPVKQIQPYRILCEEFIAPEKPLEPSTLRRTNPAIFCHRCRKRCRGIDPNTGWCRECVESASLPGKIAQAIADLGPGATSDQIAVHLKMKRLSNKIRRIMEENEAVG